jgi:O-antigen/teichoic acid export membrane protein
VAAREPDVLDSPQAGAKAIRGGMLRTLAYGAGIVAGLASAPFLIRHLGVVDFGRYVTVGALIAVVGFFTDAGLTTVGLQEYAARDAPGRRRLMANILGLRLVLAGAATAFALLFAVAVGYESVLVAGTALAAAGMVLATIQQTLVIVLFAELRFGSVSLLEFLRQALAVPLVLGLVIADADLLAFFVIPPAVNLVVLALTAWWARGGGAAPPRLEREEAGYLARESLPAAAASALAKVFWRVAIIIMSLVATAEATGWFSASFRIVEAILVLPFLISGTAFPILARAADEDRPRLAFALQRLFDVAVIVGVWCSVSVVIGAQVAIDLIAGEKFGPSVEVLRVQGLALGFTFLIPIWAAALWVLRERRALVLADLFGVLVAVVAVSVLASTEGATGAAVAMTVAEGFFALALGTALMRRHADLRVDPRIVPKALVAAGAAALLLLSPLPDVVDVALAAGVYFGVLAALRGIPPEVRAAVASRRAGALIG